MWWIINKYKRLAFEALARERQTLIQYNRVVEKNRNLSRALAEQERKFLWLADDQMKALDVVQQYIHDMGKANRVIHLDEREAELLRQLRSKCEYIKQQQPTIEWYNSMMEGRSVLSNN